MRRVASKEEYDGHELYLQQKGINFSIFYKNSYLYYNIYKFLCHCNVLNLSDLFLKCSLHEIFSEIDATSDQDLKHISLLELTIINRVLVSMNIGVDLSNHIEAYLILKIGQNDFDHILLFLSLITLSGQEQTIKNLVSIAEFSRNKTDKYDRN